MQWPRSSRHSTFASVGRRCPAAIALLMVAACQAPLDLSAVREQRLSPLQRGDLLQAAAADGDTVVVVGAAGTVISSDDAGATWRRIALPGKPFLLGVCTCKSGRFFAIDNSGTLWSGEPAGEAPWTVARLPEGTEPQAIACSESGTLWLVGGFSMIMSSADGGRGWHVFTLDEDVYLTTVQFLDSQTGYVTGEFGTVLRTVDGGESWQRVEDIPDNFYPQAAHFADALNGWVVGLDGTIWRTSDGGRSWAREANTDEAPLYGIAPVGNGLVAVGDNATVLYRRASDSWVRLESSNGTRTYLRGIVALDEKQFVVAGGGALFRGQLPSS